MNESKQTDLHLLMGPPPQNLDAARQSCAIDAAGLSPGAKAIIFRGQQGTHIRFFVQPDVKRN